MEVKKPTATPYTAKEWGELAKKLELEKYDWDDGDARKFSKPSKDKAKVLEGDFSEKVAMRKYLDDQKSLKAKYKKAGSVATKLAAIFHSIPLDATVSFELETPASLTVGQLSETRDIEGYTREGILKWFVDHAVNGLLQSKTEYRHAPMIGGERFRPIDAYVGKTGKCFIRFIEMPNEGDIRTLGIHQYVELEQSLAVKMLDGFEDYLETVFDAFDDRKGEDALAAVLDDLKLAANETYGSW